MIISKTRLCTSMQLVVCILIYKVNYKDSISKPSISFDVRYTHVKGKRIAEKTLLGY